MASRAVIIGAGGYSGAELVSLLLAHPHADIVGLFGSASRGDGAGPRPYSETFARFRGRLDLPVLPTRVEDVAGLRPDAVFLATPHEASLELAHALRGLGLRVFDLSGAFRLKDAGTYPRYYGFEHPHAALLASAVYGLPELFRDQIKTADMVAVPGCYPTASILALTPLVRAGVVRGRPIIDATSGVSGAGRGLSLRSLFGEVHQQAYNVFKHRHQPEIDAYAGVETVFTAHLGPYERGILATVHVDVAPGVDAARIDGLFRDAYAVEPFVRRCGPGVWPTVADVRHTNFCDLAWALDERHGHLIVVSAIDNLVKGAAGQAVQCMNLRLGRPESEGLLPGVAAGL